MGSFWHAHWLSFQKGYIYFSISWITLYSNIHQPHMYYFIPQKIKTEKTQTPSKTCKRIADGREGRTTGKTIFLRNFHTLSKVFVVFNAGISVPFGYVTNANLLKSVVVFNAFEPINHAYFTIYTGHEISLIHKKNEKNFNYFFTHEKGFLKNHGGIWFFFFESHF